MFKWCVTQEASVQVDAMMAECVADKKRKLQDARMLTDVSIPKCVKLAAGKSSEKSLVAADSCAAIVAAKKKNSASEFGATRSKSDDNLDRKADILKLFAPKGAL